MVRVKYKPKDKAQVRLKKGWIKKLRRLSNGKKPTIRIITVRGIKFWEITRSD